MSAFGGKADIVNREESDKNLSGAHRARGIKLGSARQPQCEQGVDYGQGGSRASEAEKGVRGKVARGTRPVVDALS